jgi:hypothetical protein
MNMKVEEYLDYCTENRIVPRYKGVEPFWELMKAARITPIITIIRIMYSGPVDQCYFLDDGSRFFSVNYPDRKPQCPEEVLNERKNPDGWEIEMTRPKNFCE